MADRKFNPAWSKDTYTVQALETLARTANKDDWSELRKEYTRMRDVAQKRIKRMAGSDFKDTSAYKSHAAGFAKLKDINPKDFPKAMAELYKFVNAKAGSITGQQEIRRKTIEAWQKQGVDLNEKNYKSVMTILEEMRKQKIVYDSDRVREAADYMNRLTKKQQNIFLQHLPGMLENSHELAAIPVDNGSSFSEVIAKFGG